jgi:excisionase family DNA binding protein
MGPELPPALLSQAEFAELIGVTARTVRRWARAGLIQEVRIGGTVRYPADALHPGIAPTDVATENLA